MNFREKMKRFWTLDVHNHEGFTLVELIIVIAILAILSTGAIAGYSAYVERANKTADQALVAEIKNVLTLYAYANGIGEGGYVVLNSNGDAAKAEGAAVIAALEDAYGENWSTALKLKYTEWTDDGLLEYVLQNADSAALIADSTFLTTATPDSLMSAVNNLTDAATTVIKNYNGDVAAKLAALLDDEFVTNLNNTGVTEDDDTYETVISNMLVGHFSKVLSEAQPEEAMQDDGMVGMMLSYATLYAYCETIGDTSTMAGIDTYLAQSNDMDRLTTAGLNEYITANCTEDFINGYLKYNVGEDGNGGKGMSDISAALEIMGAVSHISGTYTDAESLSNPNLYSSESVGEQLNNYITAINAVSSIDASALQNLPDGAVVIFIDANGTVSAMPGAVIPS